MAVCLPQQLCTIDVQFPPMDCLLWTRALEAFSFPLPVQERVVFFFCCCCLLCWHTAERERQRGDEGRWLV